MEKNLARREKRKEARSAKNHKKHQSWIEHQKSQKLKRTAKDANSKHVNKSEITFNDTDSEQDENPLSKKPDVTNFGDDKPKSSKKIKGKKKLNKTARKTKFEEFLQIDVPKAVLSAEEDLELERRLAKKLKVKKGKITGEDDGINMLFEGIPSVLDSIHEDEQVLDTEELSIKKKHKKRKSLEENKDNLEVDALKDNLEVDVVEEEQQVPAAEESSAMKTCTKRKSSEENEGDFGIGVSMFETNDKEVAPEEVCGHETSRKRRRKKKLPEKGKEDNTVGDTAVAASEPVEAQEVETELENPVSKPTMGTSVKYVPPHLRARASNESEEHTQIRRRVRGLLNKLSESNVESVTGEMSTIFLSVGRSIGTQIISQEVLASCSNGPRGNEQYAAVFAAFVAGMACSVGMDFGAKLLASLAKSFEDQYFNEDNLSLRNLTLLLSYLCIHGVCSSELIYDFLIMLSKRLKEVDVSTILTILQCCGMKIRADDPAAMKDFILSVQNRVNELKASSGDGQGNINGKRMEFMLETICDIKNNKKRPKEDTVQHTRIKKWLQKLRVEDILIRGLTWGKLLDPDKKGQWWLSGDMAGKKENVEEVASRIDKEVLEAQKMLQLAAEQRMNTDARRAIFCIIMSGEDYIDAFEKLLRLDLPAKQDREIMRVLVECCLQEKVFNKYYMVLASKLCEHDKNHKFTLQFCLWDHFKELESMELLRSMHLAKFVAEMISSFNLSLAVLKSVDFSDLMLLTPKRIIHFRMLFEALFEHPDNLVWNIFTRIAVSPELETLRHGIEFFLKEYVVKTDKKLTKKFKVAKKALNNLEGTLM